MVQRSRHSPSMTTEVGKKILAEFPGTTGSLGCAISEAVEVATTHEGYRLCTRQRAESSAAASVHHRIGNKGRFGQIRHQAGHHHRLCRRRLQPRRAHCTIYGRKLRGEADYRIIAVEPASCPSFTRGQFKYDFCDTGMICPLAKMYTLGSGFIPSANHAGGLRFHGMSATLSQLLPRRIYGSQSSRQTGSLLWQPNSCQNRRDFCLHRRAAMRSKPVIDEAMKCKESGEEKTIVFGPHRYRLLRSGRPSEVQRW